MTNLVLKVEGMSCDHCVHTVQKALLAVPGVSKAEVSLAQKKAVITSDNPINPSAAIQAVEQEGYQASVTS